TIALAAGIVVMLRFGLFGGLFVLALGVAVAVLVGKRPVRRATGWGHGWKPAVQHQELPPPPQDPVVAFGDPQVETFAGHAPPLAELPLPPALRGQIDGFALGRAKRIVEAPDLLTHAAADSESWPQVEEAVARALAVAEAHHVEVGGDGKPRLVQALALCATQGVLLAEWRQLEDGATAWDGSAARVRASDVYAILRIAEAMQRHMLPDLFAGVLRRGAEFELSLLVPYAIAQGFYLRLHGNPPRVAAA
ncbi:MAG TPA: hypothetical protein VJO72_13240, partial [Candidatus Dormibacteraeota bacterium]|nr:hypothetical protein [Candidatus Dormibacteraeota bacterium]